MIKIKLNSALMGVCFFHDESIFLQNSIKYHKDESQNCVDYSIILSNKEKNEENQIENETNINNLKFEQGPILKLLLKKNLNELETGKEVL